MKFDYNKFDYVQWKSHQNVLLVTEKGIFPDCEVECSSFLEPLIRKLALSHPEWKFFGYPVSAKHKSLFGVECNGEHLGDISQGDKFFRASGWVNTYHLASKRIQGRNYRRATSTKDYSRALKTIQKYFVPSSNQEAMQTARYIVEETASQVFNSHSRNVNASLWNLRKQLLPVLTAISCGELVSPIDTSKEHLDKLVSDLTLLASMEETHCKIHQRKGKFVRLCDDNYVLVADFDAGVAKMHASGLPSDFALKLAVLKLTEDKTYVPGDGFHAGDGSFYVEV